MSERFAKQPAHAARFLWRLDCRFESVSWSCDGHECPSCIKSLAGEQTLLQSVLCGPQNSACFIGSQKVRTRLDGFGLGDGFTRVDGAFLWLCECGG